MGATTGWEYHPTQQLLGHQQAMLEMLKVLAKACDAHGLQYYMIGGTMLGAIRHGGFIPWDNDMDIGLPRRDYEMLMQHAKDWLPKRYELVDGRTLERFHWAFARLIDRHTTSWERWHEWRVGGITIDVFPIDGVPAPGFKRWRHIKVYRLLTRLNYWANRYPFKHGYRPDGLLYWLLQQLIAGKTTQRWIHQWRQKVPFESAQYASDFDKRGKFIDAKATYGSPTPYIFADTTLKGVEQPDEYLTTLYGDYMSIPEPENIEVHHCAYLDLNTPYREFLKQHPGADNPEVRRNIAYPNESDNTR
ncbi:MAG: lipopolysaccharide cholinephosphotransferase LicD [Bacteroidetes bacterium]|nr:MAG: lipopolysaccharide cholinephosphotransferase LicD [Bacteroidota bacterium]